MAQTQTQIEHAKLDLVNCVANQETIAALFIYISKGCTS